MKPQWLTLLIQLQRQCGMNVGPLMLRLLLLFLMVVLNRQCTTLTAVLLLLHLHLLLSILWGRLGDVMRIVAEHQQMVPS